MLDRTIYGIADRASPEAPVMILRACQKTARPGGAAAVAALARGLDSNITVHLTGVVGDDRAADDLRKCLSDVGIQHSALLVDPTRPTTVKERFVGQAEGRHSQQLLRVDYEEIADISSELSLALWERINALIPECDAVLISDYAKGSCPAELLARVFTQCHALQVPVLVDPARNADCRRYLGADLMKPNRIWLEAETGLPVNDIASARTAINCLRQRPGWELQRVLLTLDRDGMLLDEPDAEPVHCPSRARTVRDVTGAGDLVQAVFGACVGSGLSWRDALDLAAVAAGLEVERTGVVAVTWDEIVAELSPRKGLADKVVSRTAIICRINQVRDSGRTVVFTNGCFDLLHAGHVRLLQQAAELGGFLIVAINSDDSIRRLKGSQRPFIKADQRAELLAAIGCVDLVVAFEEDTPIPLLQELRPDILVKGAQYSHQQVVGSGVVEAYGGQVVTLPMVPGLSTTQLADDLVNRLQSERADRDIGPTREHLLNP